MTKQLVRSFAGGEITPELAGRVDLVKYQTGLAFTRNMLILPHGPAVRRPGLEFINHCKSPDGSVRLMPFAFNTEQTAVLEIGDAPIVGGYIRFHIDGATLIEAPKTIVGVAAGVVEVTAHGWSNGDWVYFAGIARYLIVTDATTDTFETLDVNGDAVVLTAAGLTTAGRVYEISSPFFAVDLFALKYAQSSDVITITHPNYPTKELRRLGVTNWTLTDVSFAPTLSAPAAPTVTPTSPTAGNPSPQEYCITAVAADGVTESLASLSTTVSNDLSIAGNFNTIDWLAVVGASRYYIYKRRGGGFGYIGQTTSLTSVDDNILADTTQSPPEDIITLNGSAGNYPGAIAYHEQRRWFAGSKNQPQGVWATRIGTEYNLTSSIPSRDADALELRLASGQNNQVRHLIPLSDLIALTAGGEFRIFSDGAPAITPKSVSIKPQGYSGASQVQPIVASSSMLFVQAQGSRIREMSYSFEANSYRTIDLSIMAPHRFNGHTVSQLAFARAPEAILWAVRNDGVLLGLTYVPDQQVYAWHAHDTGGMFRSVVTVSESNEDAVYVAVRRVFKGEARMTIERMRKRVFGGQDSAFFVDSGLTYSGAPATVIKNLWHLEDQQVDVLADGAVQTPRVVQNGQITLDSAASTVSIGLSYLSQIRTLPMIVDGAQASGQGAVKNVSKVHLRVDQTSVFKAGPSFEKLRTFNPRQVADIPGDPPEFRTGEFGLVVNPSWNADGAVCIQQDLPIPLNLLSMTMEFAAGG